MWEEDPTYQEANYRFLLLVTAVLSAFVVIWSTWEREWTVLIYWVTGLLVVVLALAVYAGAVWLVGNAFIRLARIYKRVLCRKRDS